MAAVFGKCRGSACGEWSLSFSEYCWAHLPDRDAWLARLPAELRALKGPAALNLKKIDARELDFSHLDLRDSSFSQARFHDTLFVGTILASVDMIGTRFMSCDFVGADLRGANFTRTSLHHCSFSHPDLRQICFAEAQLRDVDLMGAILNGAVLWNADLTGARHLKRRNFADPEHARSCGISEDNALIAHESYRALKHHFHDNGLYEDGSWASYRELTMERKHFFQTRNPRFFPSLIMDLLSGYTEKPNRVILASFLIVLAFGIVFYLLNVPCPSTELTRSSRAGFFESVYFSFITFTTVGYGDLIPRPVIGFRLLACIEAFSGPFMAGLYIFTLTRRYAAS